ncbi:hypothetical protein [Kitasatospora sp. NPDC088134]|uniref:hypothetical protein n=1 Tax=Kitasatospora sp. NPDC088134 TaxID=3364071 RepID=UPI00381D0EA9
MTAVPFPGPGLSTRYSIRFSQNRHRSSEALSRFHCTGSTVIMQHAAAVFHSGMPACRETRPFSAVLAGRPAFVVSLRALGDGR